MEPVRRRPRLLVVDDEADIRGLVLDALKAAGYQVDAAHDGLQALDLLAAIRYDLVLTDLKMPGLDGLGLLSRIKELYPETDVILFTGYATIRTSVEAMRGGAYDYLPKPFDPEDLVRVVRRCLERRALLQEKERLSEIVGLLDLGRALTSNLDLEALAREIVEQAGRTFGADWTSLFLRREAAHALVLSASWHANAGGVGGTLCPSPLFLERVVGQMGEETLFGGAEEAYLDLGGEAAGPHSVMGRALRAADREIGALFCARRGEGLPRYTVQDGQLFTVFASYAAVALDNALRYAELRALDAFGRRLAAALDAESLVEETLAAAMQLVCPESAAVWVRRPAPLARRVHVVLREEVPAEVGEKWLAALQEHGAEAMEIALRRVQMGAPGLRFPLQSAGGGGQGLRSALVFPLEREGELLGLLGVGGQDPEVFTESHRRVLSTLTSSVAVALSNAETYHELRELNIQTIAALVNTVEARDPYTRGHSERVGWYAAAIARKLGLPTAQVEACQVGGLLHDIGKIGIRDAILYKPGQLTDDEHESMAEHPAIGARIVSGVARLAHIVPIIHAHQERYDGSGYPRGLKGEEIPLEARIVAVADAFEAMTAARPYKPPIPVEDALRVLQVGAGTRWDPRVVDALVQVVHEERESGTSTPAEAPVQPKKSRT
ncbi:MAG: HD domain-containing phosphohydrolase [Anaerolineae bacterium]